MCLSPMDVPLSLPPLPLSLRISGKLSSGEDSQQHKKAKKNKRNGLKFTHFVEFVGIKKMKRLLERILKDGLIILETGEGRKNDQIFKEGRKERNAGGAACWTKLKRCVCVCVRSCACACASVHARAYVCIARVSMRMYVCACRHGACACMYMRVWACACVHVCVTRRAAPPSGAQGPPVPCPVRRLQYWLPPPDGAAGPALGHQRRERLSSGLRATGLPGVKVSLRLPGVKVSLRRVTGRPGPKGRPGCSLLSLRNSSAAGPAGRAGRGLQTAGLRGWS